MEVQVLILFFDTYIVDGCGDKGGFYEAESMVNSLTKVRDVYHTYRWQKKIDVVKYTLASYSKIKWDRVVIRFECEDQSQASSFSLYCRELFPMADILNQRSATAAQYFKALSSIDESDESWIFFSPNNDHPYISKPDNLNRFVSIADRISRKYPKNVVGLMFSHFTESMVDNCMTDPQWGYFGLRFKKTIYEDADIIISKSNKAPLDSCQIFQLGYLKKIFSSTKNKGRVIRLEDTEFYFSSDHGVIQIFPKIELCRHYDSYAHIMKYVPPLFIPDGFFDKNIKLRFGYDNAIMGWVNINPLKKSISEDTDLLNLLDDIPSFWRDRISEFDINPSFPKDLKRNNLIYYNNIQNPWKDRSKYYNLIRSCYIFVILQGWSNVRQFMRIVLIKLGLFRYLKMIKLHL
jgi:hypothetical protein